MEGDENKFCDTCYIDRKEEEVIQDEKNGKDFNAM